MAEFLRLGGGTAADQVSRLIVSLLAASTLGPEVWGLWFLLNLVGRYGALSHVGVLNGLNREVPLLRGKGRSDLEVSFTRSAFGALLVSLVVVASIVVPTLLLATDVDPTLVATTVFLLVAQQIFTFATVVARSRTEFALAARAHTVVAASNLLVSVGLTLALGLAGFIVGQAISFFLGTLPVAVVHRASFSPALRWAHVWHLVRIGFPIMLVGVVYALMGTVDRWVVLAVLDTKMLGVYSVAIMALMAGALVPGTVAMQTYPRIAHEWGRSRDPDAIEELARVQVKRSLIVYLPVAIAGWAVTPWVLPLLLPEYASAVPAVMVSLVAPFFMAKAQARATILNVIDRQHLYLLWLALATGVNALVSLWLVGRFELVGVATGTVVGFAVYAAGIVWTARVQLASVGQIGLTPVDPLHADT